ncbi:hypothetical protein CcCBS67573_g04352 [Chytriomyces confervae]|uniref:RNA-binding domain-containing protein n=1 Tax=Chytriomyces confervae TaxID=246404 RepID=A0A507FGH4_9FUNG|nr:hypothetical protein CcCBS67573_g04352 [Chytriomyces confervae]
MLRSIPRLESHPMKARIVANIREIFRRADVEKRGSLTVHGLKVGFVGLLGFEPSNFEIDHITQKFNIERGELNEDAFVELMGPKVAASDVDEMIRAMFVAMDVDGCGFITLKAFKRAVALAAPHVSAAVAEDFFAEADGDRDGRLAYREFCSLLPFVVGWQELKDLFREVGTVVRADIAQAPNGKSRGFGTVLFSSAEDAANAIASYNNYEWHGRKIEVREDRAVSANVGGFRSGAPAPVEGADPAVNVPLPGTAIDVATVNVRAMYVGNLPYSVGWQDLKDLFRNAGGVVRADIPTDYQGRSKGFGTVTMSSVEEARKAIGMYNGFDWNGRRIEVREDRTFVEGAAPRHNNGPRNNFQNQQQNHQQSQPHNANAATEIQQTQSFNQELQSPQHQAQQMQQPAPQGNTAGRQLFIGNLPFTLQWQELKDLFRQDGGTVLRADIAIDNQGRSRGYGQVLMSTVEEAKEAVAKLNGTEVGGRMIEVREDKYAGEGGQQGFHGQQSGFVQGTQVFVGNLPYSSRWQDLKDLFRPLGLNPIHADIMTENETGRSKGCGMVRFASREEADKAVQNLNGTNVMGRNIIVRLDKFAV